MIAPLDIYSNLKTLEISSHSNNCIVQGNHAIFFYDEVCNLDLRIEGEAKHCKDYDFVDLSVVDRPAIILHKKYK